MRGRSGGTVGDGDWEGEREDLGAGGSCISMLTTLNIKDGRAEGCIKTGWMNVSVMYVE